MSKFFLNQAYGPRDAASTQQLYDDWSASYDAEITENGYATPGRCAAALAQHSKDLSLPILDFRSGLALRLAGFEVIDGVDVSADMMAEATGKNVYRSLQQISPDAPLDHAAGTYAAIAAIGVIGAGAAPIDVFDGVMNGLDKGGLFVFSFNDHALEDPAFEGRVNTWTDSGDAKLLFREYGPHLPGININANVYVLEKT
jgi:predicted TPR repeat methyltransferase